MNKTKRIEISDALHSLFWDCDIRTLSWEKHQNYIVSRVLQEGTWEAIQWLRATLGDHELKQWLINQSGADLDARKLRFWELILDLEPERVNAWIE
ncbi:MAG: hypothetical protein ACE5HO_10210 [bacterium]